MAKPRIPRVEQVMTRRVKTVAASDDLEAAVRSLLRAGCSGAPVVDGDGALVGVLSEHDCIRVLTQAIEGTWPTGHVVEHMSRDVETVAPTEDVLAVAARFAKGRHRRLLVTDGARLVGLVSRSDLLWALLDLAQKVGSPRERSTYEVIAEHLRGRG